MTKFIRRVRRVQSTMALIELMNTMDAKLIAGTDEALNSRSEAR